MQRWYAGSKKQILLPWWLDDTKPSKLSVTRASVLTVYRFGVEPPALNQIKRIHRQFLETGSVLSGGSSANGQCAASAIEATFNSSLLRKGPQLSSTEAARLSQQAKQIPIERFT